MVAVENVASKGEFARRCNVSPGRVSQWIASGQIGPDALDGEGRSAKIRVDKALHQLRRRLDVNQRFGNGVTTRLDALPMPDPAPAVDGASQPLPVTGLPAPPALDPTEERIRLAKLAEIEFRNRRAAEDEAERKGRFVLASESRRQMVRTAGEMLTIFEGALDDLASAIGARFEIPQRDVLHLLKTEFRGVRRRAAEAMRKRIEGAPALVEDTEAEDADA